MPRPKDYGTQFLSDLAVSPPPKPTEGLSETDAKFIQSLRSQKWKDFRQTFDPDLNHVDLFRRIRDTFIGIIIQDYESESAPFYYQVLLQNGGVVDAKCWMKLTNEQINTFEPTVVVRGQAKDEYLITPQRKSPDLPIFDARLADGDSVSFDEETLIVYTSVDYKSSDDDFDYNEGVITIKKTGVYTLTYNVEFIHQLTYAATLDGNLAYNGTTTATISSSDDNNGKQPTVHPPTTLGVGTIPQDYNVVIQFFSDENAWYVIDYELQQQTVETDFQVNTTDKKLQVKTRSVLVQPAAAESGWTDKHTGTVCP